MLDFEYRNSGQLEFRIKDPTAGIVEARTNQLEVIDDYTSAFAPGFWNGAVARTHKLPKILVDHEGRRAGRVVDTKEVRSHDGLFQHCIMQYDLESRYGSEAFHDLLVGNDDEFSHGFATLKQHVEKRDGVNVMIKDECKMWPEVSQVLAGASPGTGPISIRSALALLRLPDLRANMATPTNAMQADCPYCNGMVGASTDPQDCNCSMSCGASTCQGPLDNDADDPMVMAGQTQMSLGFLLDYRADTVTNAHDTPPKGKPTDSSQYGDPANYKYPLDSDARIHAAVAYFNHSGQQSAGGYSDSQWAAIGGRIASAANKAFGPGYHFSGGKIVTPSDSNTKMSALASGTETTSAPDTSEVRETQSEGPEEDIASFRDELKHLGIEV